MYTKRIIPCLDVNKGRVVKGVNFVNLRDAGDPVEIAKAYDREGADELVFLDITASSDNRSTVVDMVRRVADCVFIPFTVGGGIRTVEDMKAILHVCKDESRIVYHIFNSISRDRLERYVFATANDPVFRYVNRQAEGTGISQDDVNDISNLCRFAIFGFFLKFLWSNMEDDIDSSVDKISGMLNRAEIRNIHVLRDDDKAAGVLARRAFDADQSLGEPVFFRLADLSLPLFEIFFHIAIGRFFGKGADGARTENMVGAKKHFGILMCLCLIFS